MNWTKKQTSTLAVVAITSFMGTFLISSINIALPSIEKTFGLNAIMLSWVVTSFLLATAMFLLPAGRWSDISGVVRLYKAGLIIFTLSSLLCGIAPSGGWLIAARYLQGIGAAFTNTTGQAILVGSFPPQNRGSVLGISGFRSDHLWEDYSLSKLAGAPFSWQQPLSDSFQRSYRFFI